jgi:acetyltransferase-like isoleucine patch superfamily enzyme
LRASHSARPPRGSPYAAFVLRVALARLRSRGLLTTSGRPQLGRGVRFDLGPGAQLALGDRSRVGDGCRFHLGAGATVSIGAGARLGERCVIAAHERIEIGADARLDDEVVLIDFDHDVRDVERPVREQGILTAPVIVGERASVGAAAGVLRGVTIGAGARIGVRAVATHDVPAGARAEGVPARVRAS